MSEAVSRVHAIKKIADMIKDTRIAMLATVTPEGTIHSRPMATQQSEFEGELLFLTKQESSKTEEIVHQSRVTVTYVDHDRHVFVTLSGQAALSQDRNTIHQLWNPLYTAWFPQGEEDPEITVIRVNVDHAEYWETPANAIVRNYQILKAAVTKGSSKVGDHQEVAL